MNFINNHRKNNKCTSIVLISKLTPDIIVNNVQTYAEKYNCSNRLLHEILYRVKENKIIVYIPWSIDKREFQGSIYESEEGTTLEGRFVLPKQISLFHMIFWMSVCAIIIYLLLKVPGIIQNSSFLVIFLSSILFVVFDLWHLIGFRSKMYENRIIAFLKKCLNV